MTAVHPRPEVDDELVIRGNHLELQKAISKCSIINLTALRLFSQVYLGPEKSRSSKLQLSRTFQKSDDCFVLTARPPCLFEVAST